MHTHPICVTARGTEVKVVPVCHRGLFAGVSEGAYRLVDLVQHLQANGRAMTEWEKKFHLELVAVCGDARVTVCGSEITIQPIHAYAGELLALAQSIARTVRQVVLEDGWHIVSQSCGANA
ncbi:hypothetical protein K2Q16_03895 [Patescibacteria group bacterium]|nr:hypothetical protein [Patescibacteria group bacterium]